MHNTHCWRCGQSFRPSVRPAASSAFGGDLPNDQCLGCFIQYDREGEVIEDPMPGEADARDLILARREAHREGWRFECRRAAPGKHRYSVLIFDPAGALSDSLGEDRGLSAFEAQEIAWPRIIAMRKARSEAG